jgi:hypothetical protein
MVLLYAQDEPKPLIWWDAIRGLQGNIIDPPCSRMSRCWNATVIGNHGCHIVGNFWIVRISTSAKYGTIVQRFSSELGEWENWMRRFWVEELVYNDMSATLIEDTLYWLAKTRYLIAFNNATRKLSYVLCPHMTPDRFNDNIHIIKEHGGQVGLAVFRCFTLETWSSSERSSTSNPEWTPHSNVNLATLLGIDTLFPFHGKRAVRILCAFEDKDMVVVWTNEGVFQLDLHSAMEKVPSC